MELSDAQKLHNHSLYTESDGVKTVSLDTAPEPHQREFSPRGPTMEKRSWFSAMGPAYRHIRLRLRNKQVVGFNRNASTKKTMARY
ncbi:unnamed protein product [Periconia digitata]|uniref:Uncharacterized protein n=1 Tax=Periconia digitata TaxID=1303443 RepID=A0A9W4UFI8_9PLEO|nr:unnamed protein product [Periconia digitata]